MGIAEITWNPIDEIPQPFIDRLETIQTSNKNKPSSVAEKRDKIITPIGDTYDLRDNETSAYKYTESLRMKLFYANRNGYFRYQRNAHSPIVWVPSLMDPFEIKPEGADVLFEEFLKEVSSINLDREPVNEATNVEANGEANETLEQVQGEVNHDEDSLVDFNNDSFNQSTNEGKNY